MRLALMAAARITFPAVIDPVRRGEAPGLEVVGIATRDPQRAEQAAAEWDLPLAYASYDELLADPTVDAVYIATPNSAHYQLAMGALEAGKHVLCEKPLTTTSSLTAKLMATAERYGLICMEAFHWRYHPLTSQIGVILASGILGKPLSAEATFVLPEAMFPADDIRWKFELGGGALMDLGCYCIQWLRFSHSMLLGSEEPKVTAATAICPVTEFAGDMAGDMVAGDMVDGEMVDGEMSAELGWPTGFQGRFTCSMIGTSRDVRLVVEGSAATLEVINPVAPQFGAQLFLTTSLRRRELKIDGAASTTYAHQLRAFQTAVDTGIWPVTSGPDSEATIHLIEDCYQQAGLQVRPSEA
jgi:predicted dehydrogenase